MMQTKENTASEIKAVLFDLDGTLLRVQMAEFIRNYVRGLADCFAEEVKPRKFENIMLGAIRSLLQTSGDGDTTNKRRIYAFLQRHLHLSETRVNTGFTRFKQKDLSNLQALVKPIPLAGQIVESCQRRGVRLALATNPVFPAFMIEARLKWANLGHLSFSHVSSFENSCYCKPQPGYFRGIAEKLQVPTEQCLMVGNDTQHDLAATSVGMKTFLVNTWIVEREGESFPCDGQGDHLALQDFLRKTLT